METIKIKFDKLWNGFDQTDNYFTRLLSKRFNVEISDDPDFYFFTHNYFGTENYLKYKCHRIFLGWENERANWNICDYVLDGDFYPNNQRHKRFPMWSTFEVDRLIQPKNLQAYLGKEKFCCMLVSNPKAKERIEFFHKLSAYKKVDSAGRYLNNVGHTVDNKMEFIKDYKFVISFENSSYPGYTTEKLVEPMFAHSVPIYWGNPEVGKDFNTKSFINISDFKSYDKAIDFIIKLDNDEEAFREMAAQPWFNENKIPTEFRDENFLDFFDFIANDSRTKKPFAKSFFKRNAHKVKLLRRKLMWRLGVKK